MALRAEAPEFRPGMSAGDLLIQKLADCIKPPAAMLSGSNRVQRKTNADATLDSKRDKLSRELLPAGIFCPWCASRNECAFHTPKLASCMAWRIEDINMDSQFHEMSHRALGGEQCRIPRVQPSDARKLQAGDELSKYIERGASKWFNEAFRSMQGADGESVSTDLSCSEASYADSETSEISATIEQGSKLHDQEQGKVLWSRDRSWGVVSRSLGLQ
mmetsp:Transcript_14371/g.23490  ORF Transcript_14371/g.23490 Transcript_14371/m.23490 type:complete len:217 (-) Transcript_14371:314-964(-)